MGINVTVRPTPRINASVRSEVPVTVRSIELGAGIRLVDLLDIDLQELSDGALLVYDEQNENFKTTPNLDNHNTKIIGGGF
jgi:hypothetical protein